MSNFNCDIPVITQNDDIKGDNVNFAYHHFVVSILFHCYYTELFSRINAVHTNVLQTNMIQGYQKTTTFKDLNKCQ